MDRKIKVLKALADETRARIVMYLAKGEKCACAIVPFIGKAQPTVSQHLKILEESGVLSKRRDGVKILYKIKDKKFLLILKLGGIRK